MSGSVRDFPVTLQNPHLNALLEGTAQLLEVKTPNQIDQIKTKSIFMEAKINRLVYEMYGLTPQEISKLEGGANV